MRYLKDPIIDIKISKRMSAGLNLRTSFLTPNEEEYVFITDRCGAQFHNYQFTPPNESSAGNNILN